MSPYYSVIIGSKPLGLPERLTVAHDIMMEG